jgi:fatty-acyl-CoA synthase
LVIHLRVLLADAPTSEAELTDFAAQHLARYKLPRAVLFVDEMVRSPSGKADYRWAKKLAFERLGIKE